MDFLAFPKTATKSEGSTAGPWVAQEKMHGAQLVVGLAGDEIRWAATWAFGGATR